jgi:hypothetical protein
MKSKKDQSGGWVCRTGLGLQWKRLRVFPRVCKTDVTQIAIARLFSRWFRVFPRIFLRVFRWACTFCMQEQNLSARRLILSSGEDSFFRDQA